MRVNRARSCGAPEGWKATPLAPAASRGPGRELALALHEAEASLQALHAGRGVGCGDQRGHGTY